MTSVTRRIAEASPCAVDLSGVPVAISGGLGFVGSNLAHRLVEAGADVRVADCLMPEQGGNPFNVLSIRNALRVLEVDLREDGVCEDLVRGCALVFNLVGTPSHLDSMKDPAHDLGINCLAPLRVLDACRRVSPEAKVVYAGTRGQYGRPRTLPVDEDHPIEPVDVNGINKHAAEAYHLLYTRSYGLRTTSLRLSNTYGPRHQMAHSRQGIINWFVRQAMDGEEIQLWGDGQQKRDASYVDDVVEALLRAGTSESTDGLAFNIGGESLSLLTLAERIVALAGRGSAKAACYPKALASLEVGDYRADWSRFAAATGWCPETPLDLGLQRTLDYYEAHRKHYW